MEARRQTAIAESVNAFLNEDLLAVARPSAARGQGKDVTMREVLDVAAERIDESSKTGGRFAGEPLVEAQIRSTLGDTYMELGEYSAAETQVKRALALRRNALGNEDDATVRMMGILGLIHWRQNRLDDATPLVQDAFEISRRVHGQDAAATMMYEMNLANLHRAKGRYKEAEPLYAHLVETQTRVRGEDHIDTLNTMGNYANLLQETGRYEKAEPLHRRELESGVGAQGEKAPGTLSTMNNLANDLALLGRYDEAVPLMQRTLEFKIALYGPAHPSTLNSVDSLSTFADAPGTTRGGRITGTTGARRTPARPRSGSPTDHRITGTSGQHAVDLGRFADAERLASTAATEGREPRRTQPGSAGPPNDATPAALLGLRRADDAERDPAAATGHPRGEEEAGEDAGESDELTAKVRVHLGMALAALGRRVEAEPLLIEGVPGLPIRCQHEACLAVCRRFLRAVEPRAT